MASGGLQSHHRPHEPKIVAFLLAVYRRPCLEPWPTELAEMLSIAVVSIPQLRTVGRVSREITCPKSNPSVFSHHYCKTLALALSESWKKHLAKEYRYQLPVLLWVAFIFIGDGRLSLDDVDKGLASCHLLRNDPCYDAMWHKVTQKKDAVIAMAKNLGLWGRRPMT